MRRRGNKHCNLLMVREFFVFQAFSRSPYRCYEFDWLYGWWIRICLLLRWSIWSGSLWAGFGGFVVPAFAKGVSGEISRVGDATHIEFSGHKQWDYDLKKTGNKTLQLAVSPFDSATETSLRSWSDALLSEVKVDKKGIDGKYIVTFSLANEDVESFDYLTDDPSRLIIDFYRQEAKPKPSSPISTEEKKATKGSATKKVAKAHQLLTNKEGYVKKEAVNRTPAGSEILDPGTMEEGNSSSLRQMKGVFDGNDPEYKRFQVKDFEIKEEAIIASKQNIFIRFPMLEMSSSELPDLLSNSPEYAIIPRDNEENKQAQFLLTLFHKGREASFLKSYEFFIKKYPQSIYDEIVRHLAAEVYFDRYRKEQSAFYFQKAQVAYEYLLAKYPQSQLAERTELVLGYSRLERQDGVGALQTFQDFIKKYPQSTHLDHVRRAMAAAFLLLGKYEDATQTYRDIVTQSSNKEAKNEATYRLGDVAFATHDYEKAIQLYQSALKQLPEGGKKFPNALYNLAESYFWTGEYQQSLDTYRQFLTHFPTHNHDGYAMTRIGELMEILGVDQSRVMGAYLESYFRFRDSPGAGVARIRMLSQQMKGMKWKELERAEAEMKEIAAHSSLPKMDEFMNLMVADGLHHRGEYEKALAYLVNYYQKNPTSSSLPFFHKRILKNVTRHLAQMVDEKRYMDVLSQFSRYSATWLKNPDRFDVPYFLGRAYEQAGVFDEAEKVYDELLAKMKKIKGTPEERERRVNEFLPSFDELYLRLATAALLQRDFSKAHHFLESIDNPEGMPSDLKVEWVSDMAKVAEEQGKASEAIPHLRRLTDSWKDSPELVAPIYLRLAEMQIRQGQWSAAEESLNKIREIKNKKVPIADEVWVTALERMGDVFYHQKKYLSAVEEYLQLLDQYEDKRPLSYIRYKVGSILYDKGDLKGAEKVWSRLTNENGQMYKKLATERLAQAEWQDSYKKYLNRIPAMSGMREEK